MVNFVTRKAFVDPTLKTMFYIFLMSAFVIVGMVFYSNYDSFGYAVGFYYSVGIAAGLGFSYGTEVGDSPLFTSFFMLISIILLEVVVVYIAKLALSRSGRWFESPYSRFILSKFDPKKSDSCSPSIVFLVEEYSGLLTLLLLSVILIAIGVIGAVYIFGYDVMDSFYLIISTITAIGLSTIPTDSTSAQYIVFSLFGLVSVIIWGGFVLGVCELLLCENESDEVAIVSQEPAHSLEFELLRKAGMRVGMSGEVMPSSLDRNEFFVLTVARLGLLEFDGIHAIFDEFDRLDSDLVGKVSLSKLTTSKPKASSKREPQYGMDTETSSLLAERDLAQEIR